MATTTPNYGFRIPSDDDTDLMDSDLWALPLKAVDSALKTIENKITTVSVGNGIYNGAAPAGFTVVTANATKKAGIAMLDLRITRTGATIPAGNITNVSMGNISAAWAPAQVCALGTTGYGGGADAYIELTGQITLAALSIDWPQNSDLSFAGTYILATP